MLLHYNMHFKIWYNAIIIINVASQSLLLMFDTLLLQLETKHSKVNVSFKIDSESNPGPVLNIHVSTSTLDLDFHLALTV